MGEEKKVLSAKSLIRQIEIKEGFLHIPVKPGHNKRYSLQIWFGGIMIRDFYLSITDEPNPVYFFLDVSEFADKTLTLIVPDSGNLSQRALDNCLDGKDARADNPLYKGLYCEKLRPQFHFSSRRGWLNDPNGLVYADGVYHMYYQHNPLGTPHGSINVTWGHAVSSDMVSWHEKSDAILPWRRDWFIASGSALVDYDNKSGYGKNAIIAAFTALGTFSPEKNTLDGGDWFAAGGQFLAASVDGGDNFYLFSSHSTVPTKNGEGWRDPRLFRYGDKIIMAVYEVEDGVNCVSFYQSDDFHNWEKTSQNKELYECPDIFPLKTADGDEKWVLYGADGLCRLGDFDGRVFAEIGQTHPLDYGDATYAGQTWSDHPLSKRVHISWVRGMGDNNDCGELGYVGMPFSQCMSIPCELTLCKLDGKYRVCRKPIDEITALRTNAQKSNMVINGEKAFDAKPQTEYIIDFSDIKQNVTIKLGKYNIKFDSTQKTLHFENGTSAKMPSKDLNMRVLIDTTTIEAFFDGIVAATYAMSPEELSFTIKAQSNLNIQKFDIKSIWNK